MIALSVNDLLVAAGLVVALGVVCLWQGLRVTRELWSSSVRMALQLTLVGWVLKSLFAARSPWWIALMAVVMLAVAGREIFARQTRRLRGMLGWGVGVGSLFCSTFVVACFSLVFLVGPDPWYHPQYAIPLLGMLLGNTMNGIAVSMDRFMAAVLQQREAIEQQLMLGGTAHQATESLLRESLRSGLIPIINAMAVAGVVSLPGMMTGQILSGVAPTTAVRYQIFIWFLIAAAGGMGMIIALRMARRALFDERQRLRLERVHERK